MQMGHRARTIFFQSRPNPRELWPASERETLKPSGSARARACNRKRNRVPRGFLHPTSVIPHRRNRLDQPVTCVQPRTARVSASHLSAHITRCQLSTLEHHKSTTPRRDRHTSVSCSQAFRHARRRNRLDQPVTCVQPRTARVSASHLSAHVTRCQLSTLEHHKSTTPRRDRHTSVSCSQAFRRARRRNRLDQPVTCVQPRTARVSASHLSAHVTRRQPSCLEHHKSTTMRRDPPYQRVMLAGVRSFGTPIYSPAAETPKAKPSRCTWARTACTCDMGERGNALDHQ